MTVLGSREQTCINKNVRASENVNEECKSLLRNEGGATCYFYQKLRKFEHSPADLRRTIYQAHMKFEPNLRETKQIHAWDMEDIVKIGEDQRFCPYFATTSVLLQDADLVFCPYNYLIDPLVREKIKLQLAGQIIIFDEAHNIEDTCRDAASFNILEQDIVQERDFFDVAGKFSHGDNYPTAAYQAFATLCSNLLRFIKRYVSDETQLKQMTHGSYYRMLSQGADIVAFLQDIGLTEQTYKQFVQYQKDIYDSTDASNLDFRNSRRSSAEAELPKISSVVVDQILIFCRFLFCNKCQFMDDFKAAVVKQNREVFEDQRRSKKRSSFGDFKPQSILSLKIWCLNPAVAFSDIGPSSWSIVLSSGTLSPLDTFESELGIPFRSPFRLEASHVLPPDRMFVRSIGRGPRNVPLRVTYEHMYSLDFLDELGSLIYNICTSVPRGVLCFLPSYRFLDAVKERWMENGVWFKLEEIKRILSEPKNNVELTKDMASYYEAVDNPASVGPCCTGALFFAVYRGKISEGLDFADDYARVVVSVGIPYPNFKELEVEMKRLYNDANSVKKKLLPGRQWYEIQAYRALNQALGRCLRHKNDWGSLLLIDERFVNGSFQSKLSKWIRGNICHTDNFQLLINDLKQFNEKYSSENNLRESSPVVVSCDNDFQEKSSPLFF